MTTRLKAALILSTLVLIWPLCAAVWLLQWPFVRYMSRQAEMRSRPPRGPTSIRVKHP